MSSFATGGIVTLETRRRESLLVASFVLVLAIAYVAVRFVPNTWIVADCRFFLNVNETLVDNFTLEQHRFAASWYDGNLGWNRNLDEAWSNVALGVHGEYWPKHPIVISLLSTPFYLAFGVFGTLIFNVIVFAVLAGCAYFVLRSHASATASGIAVLIFTLGSGATNQLYNYNGDILLAALLAASLATADGKRGGLSGVLFALGIMIKPTAVLLLPLWLATAKIARVPRRTVVHAVVFGGAVLAAYACMNTYMFGKPWLTSYARTLVVVDGHQAVASHVGAFDTPIERGVARTLAYLRDGFSMWLVAGLGALVLLVRRPLFLIASAVGTLGTFYVFSLYRYEGDRFLFPGLLASLPLVAVGLDALASVVLLPFKPATRALNSASVTASVATLLACALPLLTKEELRSTWENEPRAFWALAALAAVAFFAARLVRDHKVASASAMLSFALLVIPGSRGLLRDAAVEYVALATLLASLCAWREKRMWFALVLFPLAVLFALYAQKAGDTPWHPSLRLPDGPPGDARAFALYAVLALIAFVVSWRLPGARAASLALLGFFFASTLPLDAHPAPQLVFALAMPLVFVSAWFARRIESPFSDPRAFRAATVLSIALLCSVGFARRHRASAAPLQVESDFAVTHAVVRTDEVPCDFLGWEHMSWECPRGSYGARSTVGLEVTDPPRVAGEVVRMLSIPAQPGRTRRVLFPRTELTNSITLRYAVPDSVRGDANVEVWMDAENVASVHVPASLRGHFDELKIDTRARAGRHVNVEIRVNAARGASEILMSGGVDVSR